MPVKLASPIMASTVEVGTPFVQFDALDQTVLVVPVQLVWAVTGKAITEIIKAASRIG